MGQPKGKTGNPNGRPKGTPNRTTAQIKSLIVQFIDANIDTLQKDFNRLDARDRLAFFEKVLRYVIPTKQASEININALSDEELTRLTDDLIAKLDDGHGND